MGGDTFQAPRALARSARPEGTRPAGLTGSHQRYASKKRNRINGPHTLLTRLAMGHSPTIWFHSIDGESLIVGAYSSSRTRPAFACVRRVGHATGRDPLEFFTQRALRPRSPRQRPP